VYGWGQYLVLIGGASLLGFSVKETCTPFPFVPYLFIGSRDPGTRGPV
jgi:hypothetical protein